MELRVSLNGGVGFWFSIIGIMVLGAGSHFSCDKLTSSVMQVEQFRLEIQLTDGR